MDYLTPAARAKVDRIEAASEVGHPDDIGLPEGPLHFVSAATHDAILADLAEAATGRDLFRDALLYLREHHMNGSECLCPAARSVLDAAFNIATQRRAFLDATTGQEGR